MTDEADKMDRSGAAAAGRPGRESAGDRVPHPPDMDRRPLLWTAATVALRDLLEPSLAAALRGCLPAEVGVHLVDVSASSPTGFHRNVQEPTCCYALVSSSFRAGASGGMEMGKNLWVDVAAEIAYPIIELLLGGVGGRTPLADRPLTALERRLLQRVPQALAEALSSALERAGFSVKLSDRSTAPSPPPSAIRQESAVLTFRLTCRPSAGSGRPEQIKGRGADGTLRVCLPVALLEAMLPAGAADLGQWAAVELSAALPDASLPATELAGLEVGDILTTDTPPDGEVTVRLAGVAKFTGRLGACDGKRAITITKSLPPPQQG